MGGGRLEMENRAHQNLLLTTSADSHSICYSVNSKIQQFSLMQISNFNGCNKHMGLDNILKPSPLDSGWHLAMPV